MEIYLNILYNWLKNAAGDLANPIAWKPFLKELWILCIIVGVCGGAIYHFTNTKNLNTKKQNWYFLIVAGYCLGFLWAYTAIRLFGSLKGFIDISNYLGICFKGLIGQFLIFYLLGYYFFRLPFFNSRKKYLPKLLTRHPKIEK